MKFTNTPLEGACVLELEPMPDERGCFARTFCARQFREHGLPDMFVQCNTSVTSRRGTLRGMHWQRSPSREHKLVRCTAGAIWDVIVDLRPASLTYLQTFGIELTAANRRAIFVPAQFAHGFQTLADNTEVFYQMGDYYEPALATGIRWNDPLVGISWPMPVTEISDRDRSWPLL